MKTLLILTIFTLSGICSFSQKNFSLNSYAGSMTVEINREQFKVDSIGTSIATNYPKFDTLIFHAEGPSHKTTIFCNFKPDSNYTISKACCGSLDIIPSSRLRNDSLSIWDNDKDMDKIQNQLMDRPFISIKTTSYTKDSIYAWHADAACETEHKLINSQLWQLGIPPKCVYWNNITAIQFFKTNEKMTSHPTTDLEEFLDISNIEELSSISLRLFDNERFVIIFDERNNNISIEYE